MVGREYEVILEGKSEISEYFYSARCLNWAPEIDGEILINDSELGDLTLSSGYYIARITSIKDGMIFGSAVKKI